jgi:hypothetical protein
VYEELFSWIGSKLQNGTSEPAISASALSALAPATTEVVAAANQQNGEAGGAKQADEAANKAYAERQLQR